MTRVIKYPLYLELYMSDATLDSKTKESIDAALASDWQKALELNLELVEKYPDDVETQNRLARAYLELGQVHKAKSSYQSVLKIDPYNTIATKNLKRLATLKKKGIKNGKEGRSENVDLDVFLEEPGKTKILNIEDIAMPRVLASLRIGDKVQLEPQRNNVIILSNEGKRLGKIEAAWSKNLAMALRAGSKFTSLVKSVEIINDSASPTFSIFVKETLRSPKLSQSVFPVSSNNFTPYVREETLGILSQKQSETEFDESTQESEELSTDVEDSVDKDRGETTQTSSLEKLAERETLDDQNYEED